MACELLHIPVLYAQSLRNTLKCCLYSKSGGFGIRTHDRGSSHAGERWQWRPGAQTAVVVVVAFFVSRFCVVFVTKWRQKTVTLEIGVVLLPIISQLKDLQRSGFYWPHKSSDFTYIYVQWFRFSIYVRRLIHDAMMMRLHNFKQNAAVSTYLVTFDSIFLLKTQQQFIGRITNRLW
jgi:hypothetical protein